MKEAEDQKEESSFKYWVGVRPANSAMEWSAAAPCCFR